MTGSPCPAGPIIKREKWEVEKETAEIQFGILFLVLALTVGFIIAGSIYCSITEPTIEERMAACAIRLESLDC